MVHPNESSELEVLRLAYERIAERNTSEQERLYHLVVGYIAGASAAVAWILGSQNNLKDIHPIFWPAASVCTTLYLAFCSYISVCLSDTALYLKMIWVRLNMFNTGEIVPSWEGFAVDIPFWSMRKLLSLFFVVWRLLALLVSICVPLFAVGRSSSLDNMCAVAIVFAVIFGGFNFVVSTCYIARSHRRIDDIKAIPRS